MFFFVAVRGEACAANMAWCDPADTAATLSGGGRDHAHLPWPKNKGEPCWRNPSSPKVADKSPNELNAFEIGPLTPITRVPQHNWASPRPGCGKAEASPQPPPVTQNGVRVERACWRERYAAFRVLAAGGFNGDLHGICSLLSKRGQVGMVGHAALG